MVCLTSTFTGSSGCFRTRQLRGIAVVELITSRAEVGHGQVEQRVVSALEGVGHPPRADVAEPGAGAELPEAGGSLLIEAEPVGDRGRLAATGHPQLGQDP